MSVCVCVSMSPTANESSYLTNYKFFRYMYLCHVPMYIKYLVNMLRILNLGTVTVIAQLPTHSFGNATESA